MSDEKWECSTAYSEEEEDVEEHGQTSCRHDITSADASGTLDGFGLKLIACEWCDRRHTALQHCLTRCTRDGGASHTPRLQVVKGNRHTMLRGCKALLLPGQREDLSGGSDPVEHGAIEDLPLTPSNLVLRFLTPCEQCKTVEICLVERHTGRVRSLADICQRGPISKPMRGSPKRQKTCRAKKGEVKLPLRMSCRVPRKVEGEGRRGGVPRVAPGFIRPSKNESSCSNKKEAVTVTVRSGDSPLTPTSAKNAVNRSSTTRGGKAFSDGRKVPGATIGVGDVGKRHAVGQARSGRAAPVTKRCRKHNVQPSGGKELSLPRLIRLKAGRLILVATLNRHAVNGQRLRKERSRPQHAEQFEKYFGSAELSVENMDALRAVRDILFGGPAVHPVVAADVLRIWEKIHGENVSRRPHDEIVTISGEEYDEGQIQEGTFTIGELLQLRGKARNDELKRMREAAQNPSTATDRDASSNRIDSPLVVNAVGKPGAGRMEGSQQTKNATHRRGDTHVSREVVGVGRSRAVTSNTNGRSTRVDICPEGGARRTSSGGSRETSQVRKRKQSRTMASTEADRNPKRPCYDKIGRGSGGSGCERLEVGDDEGGGRERSYLGEEESENQGLSDTAARRAKWLSAVKENDEHVELELERLKLERATAKEVHTSRSIELMMWMVDEQSGKHTDEQGPPPTKPPVGEAGTSRV